MNLNVESLQRLCRRRKWLLGVVVLWLTLFMLFGTAVGRDWVSFVLRSGKGFIPKGWPELGWKDWEKPTDPRELEAYNYAHSLKLPESLPKPVPFPFWQYAFSDRRTTSNAYFAHLCKTEAGEFIFKTVDKVEGLYQMRAMPKESLIYSVFDSGKILES